MVLQQRDLQQRDLQQRDLPQRGRFSTVRDMLQYRASEASGTSEQVAFTFLEDGENVSATITFAELDLRARSLAAHLQAITQAGDRVLLVYPPSLDYIVAFYACIYAGVIAVPALPPANARTLPRLKLIAQDAAPAVALATTAIIERIAAIQDRDETGMASLSWLSADTLAAIPERWAGRDCQGSDIAFLQYTSGSTGAPKGVMVSHANILANMELIHQFSTEPGGTVVSWLPPHHDMGLIGKILYPVYAGCHCVQFPPAVFLARPLRWLKALSDYRARMTAAPNFAYELCVKKVTDEQLKELDLSALTVAFNGAEPIRASTLARFIARFSPCGLRADAIAPVYGLAEATLLVTGLGRKHTAAGPRVLRVGRAGLARNVVQPDPLGDQAIELVSTSATGPGHHVVIVDPDTLQPCASDMVGEIWVGGGSVAMGYWNRAEISQQTFGARVPGRDECFLRTGDLGFFHQDELYIAGRRKEMMIFNGLNLYPQDLEIDIEAMDLAFRPNGCATFSIDAEEGTELVIVQEIEARQRPAFDDIVAGVREMLAEQHGIVSMQAIVLVKAGHLPRTSSGKIQRARCRAMYLERQFAPIWQWQRQEQQSGIAPYVGARSETERKLAAIWKEVLGDDGVHGDFLSLGGHSLMVAQIVSRIRDVFHIELPLRALFQAPTVAQLAALIDRQPAQHALAGTIPAVPRDQPLELSFAQQRLWFLDQYEPLSGFYNMAHALRLRGSLDPAVLAQSLNHIVARHEALRTVFRMADAQPHQVILPDVMLTLARDDLHAADPAGRAVQLHALIQSEARLPFSLADGPLLRARLIRLDANEHVLLLTMHHIVSDGWSMGVLLGEVQALYAALLRQQPSPLPALAVQYADYAAWQRHGPRADAIAQQLRYWTKQLNGAPTLALPTDRPRPPMQRYQGETLAFTVPARVGDGLQLLGRRSESTLFMLLMSAFSVLLARYSGQQDICVGFPLANRNRKEVEPLIGFFVNTLVLRSYCAPDRPVEELIAAVREATLDAYAHQDVPFEQLVDALQRERNLSHSPLFQVMLVMQNAPLERLDWPGLSVEALTLDSPVAKFDLTLGVTEAAGGLACTFEYNTDLFDHSTIVRMAGHFTRLLDAIVADPAQAVGSLPLLGADETAQLLDEWNRPVTYPCQGTSLQRLFEQQAAAAPQAIALVCDDERMSYGQLNARANQLAHYLRARGVGRDDLVGLCMERSTDMIVGLLGILKAGGAYLPLDPAYPEQRLAHMLADARPKLVLTHAALRERFDPAADCLCLDSDVDQLAAFSSCDPSHINDSADLAYVIYTSGSTGLPKGALLAHANMLRLFEATREHFGFGPQDSWTMFHSFAFDFSVWEIWGALLHGGKLVIVPHLVSRAPEQFHALLAREGITILNQTPSAFQQLVAVDVALGSPDTLALRKVIFGGEALHEAMLEPWFRARGDAQPQLINMYGITETTVHVTYRALTATAAGSALVGRPLGDLTAYILDAEFNPVPVGVAGELHIGGAGLARGYWQRAALTAEKFVPDPFGTRPGARLYRTGDLARFLVDGGIDYLGRIDHQVKIRGYRIELGEIEAALLAIDGIREVAVLAREDEAGDRQLAAYLVFKGEASSAEEVRHALRRHLPDHMVPAHFMVLERLPLTTNGKIDRKALPAPDAQYSAAPYVAPHTELERQLADIWSAVLKLDRVGIHDNFFFVGGNSLLATQAVSRIRSACGVEVALRTLFESPTVARLAQAIALQSPSEGIAGAAIAAGSLTGLLPLSSGQQRLWFLHRMDPDSSVYNMPIAVHFAGTLDADALARSLNEIVRRHAVLRTTFIETDGVPMQSIAPYASFDIALRDLAHLSDSGRQDQLRLESAQPFDLASQPPFRASLLRFGEADHVLVLTLHHVAADGWSMGILVAELRALYTAFSSALAPALPPLPIQYADFARWEASALDAKTYATQVAYWTAQLDQAPPLLNLPADRPRPVQPSHRGATHSFRIDVATTMALRALAGKTASTLFMQLMAAYSVLLARHSGQRDLCIGTPVANRRRTELEGLIGFFVNTVAIRTRLDPALSFQRLIEQVRTTTMDAYAHQELPFERVVEAQRLDRQASHTPLFQAMLVLQGVAFDEFDLPALRARPIEVDSGIAKFDLTLIVTERAGQLDAQFEYATDLFDHGTVARLAAHFERLLAAIVADPDQAIDTLAMLDPAERQQLLADGNGNCCDYAQWEPAHRMFERQAALHPERDAVVFEGAGLSYAELNRRANRLARHLRAAGVGPDVLAGVCVDRSPDMLVAVLAILKAGGAYLPLDAAYPVVRLTTMLDDARPAVLLTQRRLLAGLPASAIRTLCVDDEWPQANGNLDSDTLPGHLAYVIYTSGSTGQPKGVQISHRNLASSTAARRQYYGPLQRHLLVSSMCFDSSVAVIFGTLLGGDTLVLPSDEAARDPAQLCRLIAATDTTALLAVPSLFAEIVRAAGQGLPPSLSHVILAGEPCSSRIVRQARTRAPALRIFNEYGPTEATVWASVFEVMADTAGASAPIGRAIANTRLYVLDESMEPVPAGVVGQLYIGGAGLARGYLGRAALTAQAFVPNPFRRLDDASGSARLYRSGDLVRRLADGNLEFLGRVDAQVKIRGFRIELGEIEQLLESHALVGQALLLARETPEGDKRLLAYVIAADDGGGHAHLAITLGRDLRAALPDYMVPAAFIVLDRWPLLPNGKIDRKALPDVDLSSGRPAYVAPLTATQGLLRDSWQTLLGLERVGIDDHFFQLGGHSLLAMQLIARLQQAGHVLPVRQLFLTPVLRELADVLDGAAGTATLFAAPPNRIPTGCARITPDMLPLLDFDEDAIARIVAQVPGGAANIQDIYPLAPLQQGILFHHMMGASSDPYVLPVLFRLSGDAAVLAFVDAVQRVIYRHDVLRTAVLWKDLPHPVQVVHRHAALPVTKLAPGGSRSVLAQMQALCQPGQQWLDMDHAPLMNIRWAADPHSDERYVLMQYHHIVTDHVGLEIIQHEVFAHLEGQAASLPQPAPYREFVAHVLHLASQHDAEPYFRRVLGDVDAPTLPFRLTDVQGGSDAIRAARAELPAALGARLRQVARAQGVSPAILFHAAWALVLSGCSGRDDVVFGTVLSGRLQGTRGAQTMLGMFINTLPLRVRLEDISATALVRQLQQALQELLPHEQASLALAQRCSGLEGGVPLFSALFNYRHTAPADSAAHQSPLARLGIECLDAQERTNYPFIMSVDEFGSGFALEAQVAQLGHAPDPLRVIGYMETALEALASAMETGSGAAVKTLSILPPSERELQLVRWNATAMPWPGELCLHQVFERQAAATPDAVALAWRGGQLSYAELNGQANRLAHYLIDLGVRPDERVAICLERGPSLLVAMLAALKAGAAYVPLDPAYPAARLAYMLADSAPRVLLGDTPAVRPADGPRLVDLELDAHHWAARSRDNPDPARLGLLSRHLAYIIYTSGSTGMPKGVMIEHRNAVNFVGWARQAFAADELAATLFSTSLNFDLAVFETFVPLSVGATVSLVENALALTSAGPKVGLLNTVPSAMDALLAADALPASLRTVNLAGEVLKEGLVECIFADTDVARVCNLYGPSETTTYSTWVAMTRAGGFARHIGRPIANTTIYLLDLHGQPVPLGMAGEIHIGGAGVARGYLNRADLSAERFLADPFSSTADARMYRTGDLARYLPDGNIELLGRADQQVKIRGFRIELGEIEQALCRHAEVADAAVLARETDAGARLVAYVATGFDGTGSAATAALVAALREHLSLSLPAHMMPAAFVVLKRLPLTPNGKVDRQALPTDTAAEQGGYVAPRSVTETLLCAIWQDLLDVPRVGITDNFFALGGHSLLAMKLIPQLESRFAVALPIKTIFQIADLQGLAAFIDVASTQTGAHAGATDPEMESFQL